MKTKLIIINSAKFYTGLGVYVFGLIPILNYIQYSINDKIPIFDIMNPYMYYILGGLIIQIAGLLFSFYAIWSCRLPKASTNL